MTITMECIVELISIGNELLIGKIANTNAQWLANQVTSLGGYVKRICVVRDSIDEISSILKNALSEKPSFIIMTGGLGPTFDDLTLEAISRALEAPLNINTEALKMVKKKYCKYNKVSASGLVELTPVRLKMATLPKSATPLRNPVGTAPGVLLTRDESKIIALPGVPKEMEAIFEDSVKPMIRRSFGKIFINEKSLYVTKIMESTIAPLIEEAMRDFPQVYIKSHPKISEHHASIELYLMTKSKSKKLAEERVKTALQKISKLILEHGGTITSSPS